MGDWPRVSYPTSPTLVAPILGVATCTRLGIGAAADATAPLLLNGSNVYLLKTAGATTGYQAFLATNTGASMQWGIANSAGGGSLFVNDLAYSASFGTTNAT